MTHAEQSELAERRLQDRVCLVFGKLLDRAHARRIYSDEWLHAEKELLELKDKLKRLGIEL